MTPELIETFKRTVLEGAKCTTWEGVVYSLEEGIDENRRYYHVTLPRSEGCAVWCSVDGCMYGVSPDSPDYAGFIALSTFRQAWKS